MASSPQDSSRFLDLFHAFEPRYLEAVGKTAADLQWAKAQLALFLEQIIQQIEQPYAFEMIHRAVRAPFDYQKFGQDFIGALIDLPASRLLGSQWIEESEQARQNGDNCIFFANHQIEADPQVLQLLLKEHFPRLAEDLFYVAGTRVTSDPLAVPFTLGCNILSVHSKNHMDPDPEKRALQQRHNLRTLSSLSAMLNQGSTAIYIAPSGGRDRPNEQGTLQPAAFCPHSVELFMLLARKSSRPVHFYPLALSTYSLLPPPDSRQALLGEERRVAKSAVGIACGPRLDFTLLPPLEPQVGRKEQEEAKRNKQAHHAWQTVIDLYRTLQ